MRLPLRRKSQTQTTGRQRLREGNVYQQPKAFSYSSRRTDESINLGRKLPRDLRPAADRLWRFWLRRFGLLVLLLALVVSAVNILSLSSHAQVKPLTSGGSESFLRAQSEYQAAADKLLASSVWNRNKITIDTRSVSKQLLAQFPELEDVSITIPFVAHRPLVYISPVKPALVLNATNGSYVVGANGRALLRATDASDIGDLPTVNDQSGLIVHLNRGALTADDVAFIRTVTTQLAAKQYTVASMTLPAASRELDVALSGKAFFIKFNLQDRGARQQAGTFLATMAQLNKQHVTPAQYVDVRVPGRAYYK